MLSDGDILHVELIPWIGNHGARLMRPIIIGTPSAQLEHAADRINALQDAQIVGIKTGAIASDVDAILRDGLISDRLRPDYPIVTAYTLGLYTRTPRLSDLVFPSTSDWPLENGMALHLYASACGLGFSATVVVGTEDGRKLATTPRGI